MSTYDATSNGHSPDNEDLVRETLKQLGELRSELTHSEVEWIQQEFFPGGDSPPHNEKRHPEDPPGALEDAAEEVADPERIRVKGAKLGKALQAISEPVFGRLVPKLYRSVHDVRGGAISGPATVEGGEQIEIEKTTPSDIAQILADGQADAAKADRLEQQALPRAKAKVEKREGELKEAEGALAKATEGLDKARPADGRVGTPHGGLFEWVRLAPRLALVLFISDVIVTIVTLQPNVSNLINTTEIGTYLISAGISVSLIGASALAGFALAAIRLPGRVVGVLLVGLFVLLMLKLAGGMDAIRQGSAQGVEVLTATTLAAAYVGLIAGYAAAAWRDFKPRRKLILAAGTQLGDAVQARDEARTGLELANAALKQAEAELEGLFAQIEQLRDGAIRALGAALKRQGEGTAAAVKYATIKALAKVHLDQERAASDWAVTIATLAREKARVEELPEGDAVRLPDAADAPPVTASDRGLSGLQKAALAVLGLGSALGLVLLSAIPIGVGGVIAAVLLLLGGRRWQRGKRDQTAVQVLPKPAVIGSPASDDDPEYRYHPDHLDPKFRDGGSLPAEQQ